jgi:PAS domain S-box-containing protein
MTAYSAIYLGAAAVAAAAMVLAWRRRSSPGGPWLVLMLLAAAWWCFFDALEASAAGIPEHVLWAQIAYPGNMTVCAFLLLFALEYAERRRLPRWAIVVLAVVPVVGVAAAATNGWHHLIWTDVSMVPGSMNLAAYSHGWLYWAVALYNYALVLLSIAILTGVALRARATYRRQSVAVIAAVALPWVAEIVYLSNPGVLPGVDPAITLAVSGALLVLALVRFRLLDLGPVARDKLVERMEDGLLVLDAERRILDVNPAAGRILGGDRQGWIGTGVRAALSAWPEMAGYLGGSVFGEGDATIVSTAGRSITVSVVPLEGGSGASSGSLVVLRDVTAQVEAEAALRESDARSRAVISASPVPMALNDEEQHITYLNDAFVRTFGYSREDVSTLARWWPEAYPDPEYRRWVTESWQAELERTKRTGTPFSPMELTVRCKDGTSKTVLASATSLSRSFAGDHLVVLYDITARKQAEEALAGSAAQLREQLHETVKAMGAIVGLRDPYTAAHERRVAALTAAIAAEMGLGDEAREGLAFAAEVHDIGKIGVPAEILSKPASLSETELALIRQHPQAGRELLDTIHFRQPVAEIVAQHHERLDGSGYPEGLRGDDIMIEARILVVADVVEAMASHRPYRAALGLEAALAEVRGGAGTSYDADVVAACEAVFTRGFAFPEA